MNKQNSHPESPSRRQFMVGTAALVAGLKPLSALANYKSTSITVDLHSHTFLDENELNGFASTVGPDVSFISGHPFLGELPEVIEILKQKQIQLARNLDDVVKAKAAGKRVAMLATEGAYILQGKIDKLEGYHDMGLVSLQLFRDDGGGTIDSDGNLTAFGKDVIRTQNRLGMIVDVAHSSSETIEQVVKVSTKPVMLSHFNTPLRDIWSLIAESGGVIGNWWRPVDARQGMTFDDWIDNFSDIVDEVGIDHVGVQTELGTGIHRGPFDSYADWGNIGDALRDRGFSKPDTDKILGGNFMRMYRQNTVA